MSWRACAHCHRERHCHSLSPSHIAKGPEIEPRHRLVPAVGIMRLVAGQAWRSALTVIENVTVTHFLARSLVRRSACVGTVRVAPYTLQVLALIFSTRRLLETPRCVPTLPLHA